MMRPAPAFRPRGFSLVELLVVIFIIAILIAILLPALGGVRASGRKASTTSLLTGLNQAAGQFELDNRRQPGYFATNEVGSQVNFSGGAGAGLTQMENALLDLAGAGAISETQPSNLQGWLEVNPTNNTDRRIWVQPDLIGASEDSYFLPGDDSLGYLTADQQPGDLTTQSAGSGAGLPDLFDPYGQPIIAWIQNGAAPTYLSDGHDFASLSVEDNLSQFYWTANGSVLSSLSLGARSANMTQPPVPGQIGSLIGSGALNGGGGEAAIEGVMSALLGHPGYPDEARLATNDYANIFPTRARGAFVAHSAGEDGVFLGAADSRAGRVLSGDMFGGGNLNITYGVNFFSNASGDRRVGENNQPETIDFLEGFDDIVIAQ